MQAHRTHTLDRLMSEFLPQLKQQNKTDQATKLKHIADLYSVSSDNFFKEGERFLNSVTATPAMGPPMFADDVAIQIVIDAYLERQLNSDQAMGQIILERVKEDIAKNRFVHQGGAEHWLNHLIEKDRASARVFLDLVLDIYNSPRGRVSGLARTFQSYVPRLNMMPDMTTMQDMHERTRSSRMNSGQDNQATDPRKRTTRRRGSRVNRRRQ